MLKRASQETLKITVRGHEYTVNFIVSPDLAALREGIIDTDARAQKLREKIDKLKAQRTKYGDYEVRKEQAESKLCQLNERQQREERRIERCDLEIFIKDKLKISNTQPECSDHHRKRIEAIKERANEEASKSKLTQQEAERKVSILQQKYPRLLEEYQGKITSKDLEEFVHKQQQQAGSSKFCAWCLCLTRQLQNSIRHPRQKLWRTKRRYKHVWKFSYLIAAWCQFHALERVGEATLNRTVKDAEEARQFLQQFFSTLNKTRLQDKAEKLGVTITLPVKTEVKPFKLDLSAVKSKELDGEAFEKLSFGMIPYKYVRFVCFE